MKVESQLQPDDELRVFLDEIRSGKLTVLLDDSFPIEVRRMIAIGNSWRRSCSFESIGAGSQAIDWYLKVAVLILRLN